MLKQFFCAEVSALGGERHVADITLIDSDIFRGESIEISTIAILPFCLPDVGNFSMTELDQVIDRCDCGLIAITDDLIVTSVEAVESSVDDVLKILR